MSLSLAEKLCPQKKTNDNEGIFVAVNGWCWRQIFSRFVSIVLGEENLVVVLSISVMMCKRAYLWLLCRSGGGLC